MTYCTTVAGVRRLLAAARPASRIGFVPTMGALHEGHAALFHAARAECAFVAASIFVNPTQFNDAADLAAYPRQEEADRAMAEAAGVDLLFSPSASEMYPPDFATFVEPAGAAEGFEGAHRPGHFRGVATVCLKLFSIIQPHVAFFGQKDAQQVAVIRQLVRDANLDLDVRVVPTLRAEDGVALSSRNARLTTAERERARAIPRALMAALDAHRGHADPAATARKVIEAAGLEVDYVDVARFDGRPTLVIAVRAGRTRLIDNVPLDEPALAGLMSNVVKESSNV